MRILTLDNEPYDLNTLPEQVDDLRFAILDNSNPADPDYHYIPLIFLESFNSPALVLKIGNSTIKMPIDWQLLIGEPDLGDLEVVPLTSINDRGFSVFTFNPLGSFRPEFQMVEVVDIYQDVKWYFPKLKPGQLLAIPLESDKEKPLCGDILPLYRETASSEELKKEELVPIAKCTDIGYIEPIQASNFITIASISMTDENMETWRQSIALQHQVERLTDWANMLEQRVAELDPNYRTYPWGRNFKKEAK